MPRNNGSPASRSHLTPGHDQMPLAWKNIYRVWGIRQLHLTRFVPAKVSTSRFPGLVTRTTGAPGRWLRQPNANNRIVVTAIRLACGYGHAI